MQNYIYEKECNLDRLTLEIQQSNITIALDSISGSSITTTIVFKAALPTTDLSLLNAIVANHTNTPLSAQALLVDLNVTKDIDNAPIFRQKQTQAGWHYEPRSLDFYTCKVNSLYNRKPDGATINDGTDYGDAWLKFYDANDVELVKEELELSTDFQLRVSLNCVKTVCDWNPAFDIDIRGAFLSIKNPPIDPAYLWAVLAPDIPAIYGGNKTFLSGGWNLSFLPDKYTLYVDGKGSKHIHYNSEVPAANILRLIIKHSIGAEIGIQFVYENFKQ